MSLLENSGSPGRILFSLVNAGGIGAVCGLILSSLLINGSGGRVDLLFLVIPVYFYAAIVSLLVSVILLSFPKNWFLSSHRVNFLKSIGIVLLIDLLFVCILLFYESWDGQGFEFISSKNSNWVFPNVLLLMCHASGIGIRFGQLTKKSTESGLQAPGKTYN